MSPNLILILTSGALFAAGVYLLLERSLTRVLVGVVLIGNGINILFLASSGRAGGPPIVGATPEDNMSDPLPQAMVLTAIVITLAVCAFLLAMAYRSFQLRRHDEVQDDFEDRRIRRLAERNIIVEDEGTDTGVGDGEDAAPEEGAEVDGFVEVPKSAGNQKWADR